LVGAHPCPDPTFEFFRLIHRARQFGVDRIHILGGDVPRDIPSQSQSEAASSQRTHDPNLQAFPADLVVLKENVDCHEEWSDHRPV
jgi:hypothetical protein